jgi:CHAT domain-containing protein
MKYILPFFMLFSFLLWVVLRAQPNTGNTPRAQVANLISQGKYTAAASVISNVQEDSIRTGLWIFFSKAASDLADGYFVSDTTPTTRSIAVLDSALSVLKWAGWADSVAAADLWTWKAYFHNDLEQHSEVLDAYNEAIRIYENLPLKDPNLPYCYNQAAQVYIRRDDFAKAESYLKSSIENDSIGRYMLSNYSQLANKAYWCDSLDIGLHFFEVGKKYSHTGEEISLAALRLAGAAILIKKGNFVEAEKLLRQALAYYESAGLGEKRIRSHTGLADIAIRTGRLREAEQHFQRAGKIGLEYFGNTRKSREMAKLYCEWADFLSNVGRHDEALFLYQKAIVQVYPDFHNLDPRINPDLKQVPIETWAMNAPAGKAKLLLKNPTLEHRVQAADCFDLAFAAAERLRRAYGTDDAKLYFAGTNYDLRREAALNLWALHRETSRSEHLLRLFKLLETNRANALRDALQEQRALVLTGIPDSLLLLEHDLRHGMAHVQKDLAEADSSNSEQRKKNFKHLKRRYEELFTFLKKTYPRFREYSQAGQTAQPDSIRSALSPKAVLLSFFDAGDRYLCLALRQTSGFTGYEIPRDSALDQTLSRFQVVLADKSRQEADPAAFFADAWMLKQRLLPDSILNGAGNLVIVPDGPLAYLPFEALLTAPHRGAYGKAPYLLRAYAVQYAWSAALLTEPNTRQLPEKFMLHVAPFAGGARNGLAPLPHSMREIPENSTADQLQGDRALADSFLNKSSAYDILHLSTHAHAGQKEQPGIEFSDRTVALPELYAQRLNASLVALSACETNAGQFAEGEGVLSLARAFAYAGARSLVAGYWSVNDRSTAKLFAAFYRHLKSGMIKSEALRQAKLDMLAEPGADARKMPYHWAAFTLSGTDGPVSMAVNRWAWWQKTMLVSLMAALASLVWWKFGRRRTI